MMGYGFDLTAQCQPNRLIHTQLGTTLMDHKLVWKNISKSVNNQTQIMLIWELKCLSKPQLYPYPAPPTSLPTEI